MRDSKDLATNTIFNYKAAVGNTLGTVFGLDTSAWEFKALKDALFIEKPPNPPRIPSWDINKVLDLLQKPKYNKNPPEAFCQLKKTLFLVAMATGNRVSELANVSRNGLGSLRPDQIVKLCVLPGFLYKNQRLNRTPPNIEVHPLLSEPLAICPVVNLIRFLKVSPLNRGALFVNTKSNASLHPSSIARLLCELINEADPGTFPQAHDVRRVVTSIAWTRGLDPGEIAKRTFWRSTSIFIERYLSARTPVIGVALNTR